VVDALALSPEQFEKLLAAARGSQPASAGVGAPRNGLGCPGGPLDAGVYAMLAAGSPRLALAKAWGIPLAPYLINVRATFATTGTTDVVDVGSDVKIVQDTLIDGFVARVQNEGASANESVFQSESDFYFNFQSGIEVKLDVMGAPRYSVAPTFTPLSTIADMINGNSHWPGGWILTYQQQLFMQFHTDVTLPDAPMEVICTFRGWVPTNDMFVMDNYKNRDAIAELVKMGFSVPDGMAQAAYNR
jgi:hypothetical protein